MRGQVKGAPYRDGARPVRISTNLERHYTKACTKAKVPYHKKLVVPRPFWNYLTFRSAPGFWNF